MRLRSRLTLSHGIIIAIMCLVMPLALFAIRNLSRQVDALASADLSSNNAIEHVTRALHVEIAALIEMTLTPPANSDQVTAPGVPTSESLAAQAHDASASKVREAIAQARNDYALEAETQALDTFEARYTHFENAVSIWQAGRMTQSSAQELSTDFDKMGQALSNLRQIKNDELHHASAAARDFGRDMIALVGALAGLALLIGLFATVRLVGSVTELSDQLYNMVRRMSAGDFDFVFADGSIDELNALGHHFESMGRSLRMVREANLERLIVEQRRTEAVLDSIGDGLVIFSETGRIERINPVAERQLRIETGDANGKRFEEIGDAEIGAGVRDVLATGAFAHTGEPEITVDHDGESRILAYWLHNFVESESGRPGVVLVMRDVTTQREFDKMRGEFVLRASHELRTPITSIRMGLGLLGEKLQFAPGSRDRELYDTVQQEVTRMVGLLGDLLDLSRLREGKQVMECMPTDIAHVLELAVARFKLPANDVGVELELEVDDGLPRLSLSHVAFDRVLDNLIGNALRYTPSGGTIMLSAHRTPENVAIAVTDSGTGIPFSRQALIFQPFVQVGSKRGGAGLGLAICKEIVQQHGGQIRVSSVPDHGTTFTILLPV
ncbi:MAG: ATP-binding protein [Rudaea sp.]